MSAGAVLHLVRGATLVLRQGSTLALNGQLLVDAGAFICVENPASVVTGSAGQLSVDNSAYRYTNPALSLDPTLNLGGLNCQNYPACSASLSLSVYESQQRLAASPNPLRTLPPDTLAPPSFDYCTHGATITALGAGLDVNFAWTVNGVPKNSLPNRPNALNLILHAGLSYDVAVTVTSLCDGSVLTDQIQVEGTFPNCRVASSPVAMFPNPATDALDFAAEAGADRSSAYSVRLYDGQGTLRWQGQSVDGRLHIGCAALPRGLYGVVITQGETVVRRTLSLE